MGPLLLPTACSCGSVALLVLVHEVGGHSDLPGGSHWIQNVKNEASKLDRLYKANWYSPRRTSFHLKTALPGTWRSSFRLVSIAAFWLGVNHPRLTQLTWACARLWSRVKTTYLQLPIVTDVEGSSAALIGHVNKAEGAPRERRGSAGEEPYLIWGPVTFLKLKRQSLN
jgi:hypothetical protein